MCDTTDAASMGDARYAGASLVLWIGLGHLTDA